MQSKASSYFHVLILVQRVWGNLARGIKGNERENKENKTDGQWTKDMCRYRAVFAPLLFHTQRVRNERSLRTNPASADEAKQPIIHCSTKVRHLRTSQPSPGWVTPCVSPRRGPGAAPAHGPATPILRISGSWLQDKLLETIIKATVETSCEAYSWIALQAPLKVLLSFTFCSTGFYSRCYLSSFFLQKRNLILGFFFSLHTFW